MQPMNNEDEIDVFTLKTMMDEHADFILLDVRNPDEYEICNLQGKLIPLSELPQHLVSLDKEKNYIVHCRSGGRSYQAMQYMRQQGFKSVKNLQGGILDWARKIDTNMATY